MGVTVNAIGDIQRSVVNAKEGVGKGAKCPLRMVHKPQNAGKFAFDMQSSII